MNKVKFSVLAGLLIWGCSFGFTQALTFNEIANQGKVLGDSTTGPTISSISPSGPTSVQQGVAIPVSWVVANLPANATIALSLLDSNGNSLGGLSNLTDCSNGGDTISLPPSKAYYLWSANVVCANWHAHPVTAGGYKIGVTVYSGNSVVAYGQSSSPFAITTLISGSSLYDYNNDGKVDTADYSILLMVVNNLQSCPTGKTCDVNGDNMLSILDLNAFAQYNNLTISSNTTAISAFLSSNTPSSRTLAAGQKANLTNISLANNSSNSATITNLVLNVNLNQFFTQLYVLDASTNVVLGNASPNNDIASGGIYTGRTSIPVNFVIPAGTTKTITLTGDLSNSASGSVSVGLVAMAYNLNNSATAVVTSVYGNSMSVLGSAAPTITNLSPVTGSVGTQVTISGSGFALAGNTITLNAYPLQGQFPSSDGSTLTFMVPSTITQCVSTNPGCGSPTLPVGPGSYRVSVYNSTGPSNQNFIFTVAPSADTGTARIQITSPLGGEQWQLGSTHTITWIGGSVNTSHTYTISLVNGSAIVGVIGGTNSNQFTWTIGSLSPASSQIPTGSNYKIAIQVDGAQSATSNSFSITPLGSTNTLTTPNITQLSANSGPVNTSVAVNGSGFLSLAGLPLGGDQYGDGIWISNGSYSANLFVGFSSEKGITNGVNNDNTFYVTIPALVCPGVEANSCSSAFQTALTPGVYSIYTKSNNGQNLSNKVTFNVTTGTASATTGNINLPDGTILKLPGSPTVYLVSGGTLQPFTSAQDFLGRGYSWSQVQQVSPSQVGMSSSLLDGTAVKSQSFPTIFVIRGGMKYGIPSLTVFKKLGLSFKNVKTLSDSELDTIPDGGILH